jgi:hypothetical protein
MAEKIGTNFLLNIPQKEAFNNTTVGLDLEVFKFAPDKLDGRVLAAMLSLT